MRKLLPFIALLLLVSCGSEPDNPADSEPDSVCEYHFEGNTYRGCGNKEFSILTFNDGSNVMLGDKYLNYSAIDSIRCTRHSFEATYHSCGKGFFNFQKQDLKFIKDKTLYEEIAYYYVIQDFEENLCEEPTAVLLSQGGEKFYLNTLKGAKNACDFPENSIVSCQAYRLEVFTKEGVFNEVVIYEMNSATRKK